ncbi:glycosyltransferase [Oscillospiraceae bacterium WX1]
MDNILWLTNIPAPYRVDFFNALGSGCALTVLFEKKASGERDRRWVFSSFKTFTGIFLKGVSIRPDMAFCPGVIRHLRRRDYDGVVISNPLTPTGILAVAWLKLLKRSYMIEGDGGLYKKGNWLRAFVKKRIFGGAAVCFSTGDSHDAYFLSNGAREDALCRYHFTSLYERDIRSAPPSDAEKGALRRAHGIPEAKMVLTVGRFVPGKGFECLLGACRYLDRDTGIYLIGGQPTAEYRRLLAATGHCNIHFLDFMGKEKINCYFDMADVFVLPTRADVWGLVVSEAMARGLPVVTTDACGAGAALITNGENGYIIPAGDEKALAEQLLYLLNHDGVRHGMAEKCLQRIRGYTIETMAAEHLEKFRERCRTTLIFLGALAGKDGAEARSGGSVAGNAMQLNLLKHLSALRDFNIEVLALQTIGAYPKDKTFFSARHYETVLDDTRLTVEFVPFLNIPLIKQLWQALALCRRAKQIARRAGNVIVLSYNLYPQTGLPLLSMKKHWHVAALLADLPFDDRTDRPFPGRLLLGIFNALTKKIIAACPNLIVLNRHAAEQYNPNARFIVMEGGVDHVNDDGYPANKTTGQRRIVYSGSLTAYNGISALMDAMALVEHSDVRLHIYGKGQLESAVRNRASMMANVYYDGSLKNAEIRAVQKDAWLLINPRLVDDPIAQVTFPSKILEYMQSGTPVLTTRLNGFHEAYNDKLFFIQGLGKAPEIAEAINHLADLDEATLADTAEKAKNFVCSSKTWAVQARKVNEFLKDIGNGRNGVGEPRS